MSTKLSLSWGQRFALINAYRPTDEQIQRTFNITSEDLAAARQCLESGTFKVDEKFNVETVGNVFSNPNVEIIGGPATPAQKQAKTAKKRGRKGDKIFNAFSSIPAQPISATKFANQHGVSIAVLRQAKRFDSTGAEGVVHVKKIVQDGGQKELMIWRA